MIIQDQLTRNATPLAEAKIGSYVLWSHPRYGGKTEVTLRKISKASPKYLTVNGQKFFRDSGFPVQVPYSRTEAKLLDVTPENLARHHVWIEIVEKATAELPEKTERLAIARSNRARMAIGWLRAAKTETIISIIGEDVLNEIFETLQRRKVEPETTI